MSTKYLATGLIALRAVTAATTWPSTSYVTENFTSPVLDITLSNGTTAPGYLFFDPSGAGTTSQAALITTDQGELIWHGPDSDPLQPPNYQNFRVANLAGESVLTYWFGYSLATFGHGYGGVSVLDQTYNEIYHICVPNDILQIYAGPNVTHDCYHDQHESFLTPQGTIVTSAYNTTQADLTSVGGPADGWILDGMFHEIDIKTNEVLFTWRSTDHLDEIPFTASKQPLGATGINASIPWDFFHINSIEPVLGGYLVNSRHLFTTYFVSSTGTIEWTISGDASGPSNSFTQDADVEFSWQHFPRVVSANNETLVLDYFNNFNAAGKFNGTNSTTGLELSIDLTTNHITRTKTFWNPNELLWADSQGDLQIISPDTPDTSNYLMGYGQLPVIREYTNDASLIYQAQFGPIYPGGAAGQAVSSYRAYKNVWTGTPTTSPKVVATGNGTIYVSWNGATDVTSYQILAGSSASSVSVVATVPKTGFETAYSLGSPYAFVQVVALNGTQALFNGSSAVVAVGAAGGSATSSASATSASATSTVAPYQGAGMKNEVGIVLIAGVAAVAASLM